jgi:hypothetical protein
VTITALDTETHLIKPGCVAPKLVCVTTSNGTNEIFDSKDGLAKARALLESDEEIIGHHVFFDLCVLAAEDPDLLPLIFRAIDEGRIHCTKIRQMIVDNAEGKLKFIFNEETNEYKKQSFALARLVQRHLGHDISKSKEGDDAWRLRYNELDGVPLKDWPDEATAYAISDAMLTREVYLKQEEYCEPKGLPGGKQGEIWQTQAAWALYLMGAWGVRTDPEAVAKLRTEVQAEYEEVKAIAQKWGFVRTGIKESRDTKAIMAAVETWYREHQRPFKYTDGGKVATDREQLTEVECVCGFDFRGCSCDADGVHRGLWAVAEVVRLQKLLSTYIRALERGTKCSQGMKIDGVPMGTQLQNPPRKHGVRECFVPRPGWVFAFCDFDTLEMLTLAQVCIELFGYSHIADAAWRLEDFHLALAADMMEMDYLEAKARLDNGDERVADMRQGAKIANYGFAGGMSWRTFISYAKGFGAVITPSLSKKLHSGFRRKWREMNEYFRFVSTLIGDGNRARVVEFPKSKMMRGNVTYTATANGFFQHRAAMGAKAALYQVSKECYLDLDTPLYGCRPFLFAHDEIGMEIPYSGKRASDAAFRLQSAMIEEMSEWCPDVPIAATAVMSRRWYKGAKPVYENDEETLLLPCRPEGKQWVADVD